MTKWFGRKAILFWPVSVPGWVLLFSSACAGYFLLTPSGLLRLSWNDPGKLEPHLVSSPLYGVLFLELVLNFMWLSTLKLKSFDDFKLKILLFSFLFAWVMKFFMMGFWLWFGFMFVVLYLRDKIDSEKDAQKAKTGVGNPLPVTPTETKTRSVLTKVLILDWILLAFHLFEAAHFAIFEGKPDRLFIYGSLIILFFVAVSLAYFRTRTTTLFLWLLPLLTLVLLILCCVGVFAFIQMA
jgi:hypothetical protein